MDYKLFRKEFGYSYQIIDKAVKNHIEMGAPNRPVELAQNTIGGSVGADFTAGRAKAQRGEEMSWANRLLNEGQQESVPQTPEGATETPTCPGRWKRVPFV